LEEIAEFGGPSTSLITQLGHGKLGIGIRVEIGVRVCDERVGDRLAEIKDERGFFIFIFYGKSFHFYYGSDFRVHLAI